MKGNTISVTLMQKGNGNTISVSLMKFFFQKVYRNFISVSLTQKVNGNKISVTKINENNKRIGNFYLLILLVSFH